MMDGYKERRGWLEFCLRSDVAAAGGRQSHDFHVVDLGVQRPEEDGGKHELEEEAAGDIDAAELLRHVVTSTR